MSARASKQCVRLRAMARHEHALSASKVLRARRPERDFVHVQSMRSRLVFKAI